MKLTAREAESMYPALREFFATTFHEDWEPFHSHWEGYKDEDVEREVIDEYLKVTDQGRVQDVARELRQLLKSAEAWSADELNEVLRNLHSSYCPPDRDWLERMLKRFDNH